MTFVSVRDLRGNSARVWRRLQAEHEIVITSNGKPIAILSPVSEKTLEPSLTAMRRARAMGAVLAMQQQAALDYPDGVPKDEVEFEIKAARKHRPK